MTFVPTSAARIRSAWFSMTAGLLMLALLPSSSLAQDQQDEWQFRLTPYAWVPSLNLDATIGAGPAASSDTALLDILDFAFLSSGEARKGRWGLIAEFNYLALSDEFSFVGGLVRGESELKGIMGGAALAYRFVGDETAGLDAFGGFRIWSLEATADFRILPTVSRKTTFVDPIIGLRGTYDLTPDWFVTGLVEVGGFGAGSDFQWETVGRVAYRFNDSLSAGLGYRHLALQVDRGGLDLDAAISGPFLALDINF